ncbi:hypothetical protein AB84_3663 [Escherichia coli 2-052-05_S3_C1]|nr:hypothetical protein AB84_3663 [Escherichia coli 2-052-05_S3_C1]KDV81086.1 hypothetical protein AC42_3623 [Escherichia coli 2-052-05_S3_C3]KEN74608.1 hypothetical protein AC14_3736 [Escherichia coli 2-052-05_S3_C2]
MQGNVGLISVAHQAILPFIITLKPGKPGFFILICNNPKKCEVPRRFHISLLRLIFKFLKI